jgi:hypothetical protein
MSEWFYARDDERHGPVPAAELRRLADCGDLASDDLVWRPGFSDWVPAGDVGELGLSAPPRTPLRDEAWEGDWSSHFPQGRGLSMRAKVLLIVGSTVLGLLLLGGLGYALLVRGASDHQFSVDIAANQSHKRVLEFEDGATVTITVHSDIDHPFTDVDLYVFEADNGRLVTCDELPDQDCQVTFHVPKRQKFEIELRNLGPGSAHCTVRCDVSKPGR